MSTLRWLPFCDPPEIGSSASALERELGLPAALAAVLARRGLATLDEARNFLTPRLKMLGDPFELPNMPAAVERILRAVDAREHIVLYGDYDVDGVTSLAILSGLLRAYGADVQCFLPLRIEEGYGLSRDGIDRCLETLQPRLLIAVDCGTASAPEIAFLQAQGVDVIVIDHHEAQTPLPAAVPLVNPKLGSRWRYLCSAGLAFKTCHALLKRRPLPGFDLKDWLDLVALGTVADLVPLVEENRILVRSGCVVLARTARPGLRALMEVAGVRSPVRPSDIGYRLGPRLNAAGRLGTAEAALDLLTTSDPERAATLARELDEQNRARQAVEQSTLLAAQEQLASSCVDGDAYEHAAIVVGARGWHPGVLGIVAARLMRMHHRPTLVVGFDDEGVGKGSGRSIAGLSLVQALTDCASLLDRFGGHEMAAGLSIRESVFVQFQDAFRQVAALALSAEQLKPCLHLDAEVTLAELDADFLAWHEALQPFGLGNPQPTFLVRGVVPVEPPRILKEKHLRLLLRQPSSAPTAGGVRPVMSAIYFQSAHLALPPPPWDVALQVEANEYRGQVNLQAQVEAIRAAAT